MNEQHAAIWDGGALVLGPISIGFHEAVPAEGTAISQALRRIGVTGTDETRDEFDVVGLRRHRRLEDWLPDLADNE